jgi:hypothetical protein
MFFNLILWPQKIKMEVKSFLCNFIKTNFIEIPDEERGVVEANLQEHLMLHVDSIPLM